MNLDCWIVEVQVTNSSDGYKTVAVFLNENYARVFESMLNEAGGYSDIKIEKRVCDISIKSGYL